MRRKSEQKTGVEPAQIVDWLSLIGDSSDNIPGVPGIGLKIAADLLGQFGSVDVLYERLPEVSVRAVADAPAGGGGDGSEEPTTHQAQRHYAV
jgi:5'-3' exonuclease